MRLTPVAVQRQRPLSNLLTTILMNIHHIGASDLEVEEILILLITFDKISQ